MIRTLVLTASILCVGAVGGIWAQSPDVPPTPRTKHVPRAAVPHMLRPNIEILGDWVSGTGKERIAIAGRLVDERGTALDAQLLVELPLKVRLARADGKVLVFDGVSSRADAALDEADEALLETFAYDSPQGFFSSLYNGGAMRLLGFGFRNDDGSTTDYRGPWFDIFELVVAVRTGKEPEARAKHFYFDSNSKLLQLVRYAVSSGGAEKVVETYFSDWQAIAGQQVPGKIRRTEDSKQVFLFEVVAAVFTPAMEDGVFSNPR